MARVRRTFTLELAKLAFVAVARKLLTILNGMVRERTLWQQA